MENGFPSPVKILYRPISWILIKTSVLNITLQLFLPGFLLGQTSCTLPPSDNVFSGVVRAPADTCLPIISNTTTSIFLKILQRRIEYLPKLSQHFPFSTVWFDQDLLGYSQWSCWSRPRKSHDFILLFHGHFTAQYYLGWE